MGLAGSTADNSLNPSSISTHDFCAKYGECVCKSSSLVPFQIAK